jgi:hypothetical protein
MKERNSKLCEFRPTFFCLFSGLLSMKTIYIKDVLRQVRLAGNGFPLNFDIEYRRADGTFGSKKDCTRAGAGLAISDKKRDMASISYKESRASKLQLEVWEGGKVKVFDIWICLLVKFNGQLIDPRF